MKLLFVGSLSSFQAIILIFLYFALMCYLLVMAIRNEQGSSRFLWAFIILFVPIIGVLAYLIKHLLYKGELRPSNK